MRLTLKKRSCNGAKKPSPKYLTANETAKHLGVDISTLWRWDKTGYLTKVRVGGKVRYRLSDVTKLMEG